MRKDIENKLDELFTKAMIYLIFILSIIAILIGAYLFLKFLFLIFIAPFINNGKTFIHDTKYIVDYFAGGSVLLICPWFLMLKMADLLDYY